jgi:hypothetical protein
MSDPIDWKGLSVDKGIDAILIPVGLFAALWFQGWVDDRKEREDYGALIADFKTEAEANRLRSESLAASIGPFAELDDEKVLGPIAEKFDMLGAQAADLAKTFDCFDLYVDVANEHPAVMAALVADEGAPAPVPAPEPPPAPDAAAPPGPDGAAAVAPVPDSDTVLKDVSEEEMAALMACADVLEPEQLKPRKPFAGADFSPVYQYIIWQVYLQSGIRLFKDSEAKGLGKLLGAVYASKREVERRVEEVEALYNDGLMKAAARLAALEAEFADLWPDKPTAEDLKAMQEHMQELSGEAIEVAYEVESTRVMLAMKVGLLKRHMLGMQGELDATLKGIDSELQRLGKPTTAAPAPAATAPPTKG